MPKMIACCTIQCETKRLNYNGSIVELPAIFPTVGEYEQHIRKDLILMVEMIRVKPTRREWLQPLINCKQAIIDKLHSARQENINGTL